MKPRTLTTALLLAAVLAPGRSAADDSDPYELKPNLVVTPSRTAEQLDDAMAAVSVISRQDIELSAAEDLLELLRLQPGIDIVRSGGAGAQTSIFMRGSNSNHVLVLIDGVRVASANTGAWFWEQLPLNQVERIEIVRGPRGSLYGSDSIGGVIQVFTRSSPRPYARATGGSYGTGEFEGGLGYQGGNSRFSINAGYRDTDGFSAQNPNGFSFNPDNDGFRSANLGLNGSVTTGYGNWRYSAMAIDSETEFDEGVSDDTQVIASLSFTGKFSRDWEYQLRGGLSRDKLITDFGFFTTDFRSRRYEAGWQNQLRLGDGSSLGFGIDYYTENGQSEFSWDESRNNTGLYVNYDREFGRLNLQLGGRFDDNSRFGSKATGQVALGWRLDDQWRLMASYGSAFRGPNLSEQFSPGFGGLFAGNPDLDPESSTSGEIGLRWHNGRGARFSAVIYRTDVDDLIAFNGPMFQAVNVARARLQGLELSYDLSIASWRFTAGATLQDTEDRTTGEALLRRPDEKASAALDRYFPGGSWVGLEWFWSGERSDFGGITLDRYQLFSLRGGWAFSPTWQLELRGENLLDENYEPAFGFNAAGRSWFLSLAWRP